MPIATIKSSIITVSLQVCHRLLVFKLYWFPHNFLFYFIFSSIPAASARCWLTCFMSSVAEVLCFLCVHRAAVNAVRNLFANSCLFLCYCCHEEGQGKLLTFWAHTQVFLLDLSRLDMKQVAQGESFLWGILARKPFLAETFQPSELSNTWERVWKGLFKW